MLQTNGEMVEKRYYLLAVTLKKPLSQAEFLLWLSLSRLMTAI
jgi:hypothetical protein